MKFALNAFVVLIKLPSFNG